MSGGMSNLSNLSYGLAETQNEDEEDDNDSNNHVHDNDVVNNK